MVTTEATISLQTAAEALALLVVFALPVTTLYDYNIWSLVPKYHFTRCHLLSVEQSWAGANAVLVAVVIVLLCLFLEFRKRKLGGLVEDVLQISGAAAAAMDAEEPQQAGAARAAVRLLDSSSQCYEHLLALQAELRARDGPPAPPPPGPPRPPRQAPPAVASDVFN